MGECILRRNWFMMFERIEPAGLLTRQPHGICLALRSPITIVGEVALKRESTRDIDIFFCMEVVSLR